LKITFITNIHFIFCLSYFYVLKFATPQKLVFSIDSKQFSLESMYTILFRCPKVFFNFKLWTVCLYLTSQGQKGAVEKYVLHFWTFWTTVLKSKTAPPHPHPHTQTGLKRVNLCIFDIIVGYAVHSYLVKNSIMKLINIKPCLEYLTIWLDRYHKKCHN
jgi:hypothetical protein